MSWCNKSLVVALGAAALFPGSALAWTKSYVVEYMAPAFYYGARATGGEETPGTDCPNGINPENDRVTLMTTHYRTRAEAEYVLSPEFRGQGGNFYLEQGFRGPNRELVFSNPTSWPDPGFIEGAVEGNLAYGFDLDDNPNTGFKGVDGAAGVDNMYYKTSACISSFRGVPKNAYFFKSSNDRMRDGERTMLVVMSGKGEDPMNDPDVSVGVYASTDYIIKDANGAVTPDMTFRIDPNHQSMFKAKITDGVLEAVDRPFIHFFYAVRGSAQYISTDLHKSKMRLVTHPDGSMKGHVGGYREWFKAYAEYAGYGQPTTNETLGNMNMQGWYYALRRNADGLKGADGHNRGISATFSLDLLPAFVTSPDNEQVVQVADIFPK